MNQQRSIIRNAKNNREVRVVSNDLVSEETSNEEVSEDQPKVVMPTFKVINEYKRKRDRERFQGIRDGTISFPEQRRRAPQREVKKEEHPQTEQPTVTEKPKRENKRRNNRMLSTRTVRFVGRKNTPPKEEQPVETAEEPTRLLAHLNLSFDGDKTVTITVYDVCLWDGVSMLRVILRNKLPRNMLRKVSSLSLWRSWWISLLKMFLRTSM